MHYEVIGLGLGLGIHGIKLGLSTMIMRHYVINFMTCTVCNCHSLRLDYLYDGIVAQAT